MRQVLFLGVSKAPGADSFPEVIYKVHIVFRRGNPNVNFGSGDGTDSIFYLALFGKSPAVEPSERIATVGVRLARIGDETVLDGVFVHVVLLVPIAVVRKSAALMHLVLVKVLKVPDQIRAAAQHILDTEPLVGDVIVTGHARANRRDSKGRIGITRTASSLILRMLNYQAHCSERR